MPFVTLSVIILTAEVASALENVDTGAGCVGGSGWRKARFVADNWGEISGDQLDEEFVIEEEDSMQLSPTGE